MSKKRLVIFDRDERYAGNLMEYLGSKEDFPYSVSVYSKKEALLELAEKEPIQLLLASESAYADIKGEVKADRVMILNESGELTFEDLQNIKKYQSAEHIVREIMHYYVEVAEVAPPKLVSQKQTKIIGFFSPVRRCLQTTMGLTLGQIMAEHAKTLYLNFESLSGFPYLLGYSGGRDLSDLLYYLETSPEKFGMYLQNCVQKLDNLDYVLPMNAMHQMLLVSPKQWRSLVGALAGEGNYEVVILDLSEGMQGLFEILRMCTHIYTLVKEDGYARAKIEQYEQLLQLCEYQDVLQKTWKRKIPYMREIPDGICYQPGTEFSGYVKNMLKEDGLYG